jgi:hypothetical protein
MSSYKEEQPIEGHVEVGIPMEYRSLKGNFQTTVLVLLERTHLDGCTLEEKGLSRHEQSIE